jgi:hypothetical protein
MDEAFILACKKLVVIGGAAGFSVDDMLTLLLNGMTVDQLLDVIQQRLIGMAMPHPMKSIVCGTFN